MGRQQKGKLCTVICDCGKTYNHKVQKTARRMLYLHAKAVHGLIINTGQLGQAPPLNATYSGVTGTMKTPDGMTWEQRAAKDAAEHVKYIKELFDAGEPIACM